MLNYDSHFLLPLDKWWAVLFHVLIGLLFLFLLKCVLNTFIHFFNWVVYTFVICCENLFMYFGYKWFIAVISIKNIEIFYHIIYPYISDNQYWYNNIDVGMENCVDFLYIFIVSFNEQKFLILIEYILFYSIRVCAFYVL